YVHIYLYIFIYIYIYAWILNCIIEKNLNNLIYIKYDDFLSITSLIPPWYFFIFSFFFPQLYPGVLTIIFLFNKSTLTLCLFPLIIYLAVLFTLNNVSCIYPVFIYTFSNSFKLKKKRKILPVI
ncbi:Uncharacterized protein cpbgf_2003280, partial [Cryptosporidium parvum]